MHGLVAIMGVIILLYFIGKFITDSMALVVITIPIFSRGPVYGFRSDLVRCDHSPDRRYGDYYTTSGCQRVCYQGDRAGHPTSRHFYGNRSISCGTDPFYHRIDHLPVNCNLFAEAGHLSGPSYGWILSGLL